VRLATTAFSFTNEWLARRYTLEQLLRRVAELDLGPGIELIGFQAWRRYPDLPAEDVIAFRRLVDELGLEPAALGAYVDLARRVDRPMTTPEAVDFLAPQIAIAADLGFPLLRLHAGIPLAVLEQLTPAAERAGVTLATEVQGGQTPDDLLESPNVGLVLDFSVAMTAVPATFVDTVRRLGMASAAIEGLVALWAQDASPAELFAAIGEIDAPAAALDEARAGFVRFGRQDPQAWAPLVPQVAYAHAKFWELDDAGDDPATRTAELIDVLRDGGYDGFLSSEWGGSAWRDADEVDAFELVRRHHELISSPVHVRA
jgi:sugar phosphate isomerase/epimerase